MRFVLPRHSPENQCVSPRALAQLKGSLNEEAFAVCVLCSRVGGDLRGRLQGSGNRAALRRGNILSVTLVAL